MHRKMSVVMTVPRSGWLAVSLAVSTALMGCSQAMTSRSQYVPSVSRSVATGIFAAPTYRLLYKLKHPRREPPPLLPTPPLDVNGTLYGVVESGGPHLGGWVFSVSESGKNYRVLHFFGKRGDGATPTGGLVNVSGTLYGTTAQGGHDDMGTVYSLSTSGSNYRIVHHFDIDTDGDAPCCTLIFVNGFLYGTTAIGGGTCGRYACAGTVFRMSPDGKLTTLHRFIGSKEGSEPSASLTYAGGVMYGTTLNLGAHGGGTVFSITPLGSLTVLYSLHQSTDGVDVQSSVVDVNGKLYGAATNGGQYGDGTVFSLNASGGGFRVLHAFDGEDGWSPIGAVLDVRGTLYGTTNIGGESGVGNVFSLGKSGANFTIVHTFNRKAGDGGNPSGMQQSGSRFLGATGLGTIYSLTP